MDWKVLDTREWASVAWLTVLVVAGSALPAVRQATVPVLRTFFGSWKLVVVFSAFLGWVVLVCYLGSLGGVWNRGLLVDTVAWVLVSGFVLVMSAHRAVKDEHFFRRAALTSLGLTALVQFVLNLYTFQFAVEMLLVPVVTFLLMLKAFAGADAKTRPVGRVASGVVAGIGLWIFVETVRGLAASWRGLDARQTGIEFAFSIWFPLVVLPFVYVIAVVIGYETALTRRPLRDDASSPPFAVTAAAVVGLRGNLRAVDELPQYHVQYRELVNSSTYREARASLARYKAARAERRRAEEEAAARLVMLAGVKGCDSDGSVLDQREIKETSAALRWLETCHLGHYNNLGRYREDLLTDVLSDDFSRQGLAGEHGITMRVSRDSQAWYAWRRTPSGQVLGIGMSSGRSYEWLYDAEEPPEGFPGTDLSWGDTPFATPPNWR